MTLAEALSAERDGRIEDAAAAYEGVLLSTPDDLTTTINLIVLYWQATDFGISATQRLSPAFVVIAGRRLRELLEEPQACLSSQAEFLFWRKYIAWADLGEPLDPADCREFLRQNPQYLEPAFVVFSRSAGVEAEAEAMKLLERCSKCPTARCRYIESVIDGVLKRRRPRKTSSPS